MAREAITGSRIRERRLIAGLRQAELARAVGISASYLNLIEHNRRRIGGKLLVDIAQALSVEPSILTDGAEAALLGALREAAAEGALAAVEVERAEEFAGRFPGWAELLTVHHRRIETLERTVQTLSDRLTHDPHLASSLHEVLSTAASIRSTASILAETDELEPEWQDKFHRNINQDAERLADSSRALVKFLDDGSADQMRRVTPQEEAEAFFQAHGFHFPSLEPKEGSAHSPEAEAGEIDRLVNASPELGSAASRTVAARVLHQVAADAALLSRAELASALATHGADPIKLLWQFGGDLSRMMRRIAFMPDEDVPEDVGYMLIDGSGAVLYRKLIPGFALAGFGASCPLWPIYSALHRPMHPVSRRVRHDGRSATVFDCYAYAWPHNPYGVDGEPLFHSAMLVRLVANAEDNDGTPVGNNCRICPRSDCDARREPSILKEEF